MTQLCSEATHLDNNGEPSSLLDLAFTNVPHLLNYQALVSQPISTSDHLPTLIKTSITHQPPEPVKNVSKSWMYSQKDHVKMMNSFLFDEWSHVFQPEDDINEIWIRWKQQFFLEVESFIPCVQRTSQDRPKQPPWFNRSIGQLIRTKNRLFNRARSSGLPDHWEKYKAARNKATNHIRMAKSRNYFQIANTGLSHLSSFKVVELGSKHVWTERSRFQRHSPAFK